MSYAFLKNLKWQFFLLSYIFLKIDTYILDVD